MPTSTPESAIRGWRGEYYDNQSLTGAPTLVRDDAAIDFAWGTSSPAVGLPSDGFAIRWSRNVFFSAGTYRFRVRSDDGVRVWLDGVLIIDKWRGSSGATHTAKRALNAGVHALRVEYHENSGLSEIQFWWERLTGFPQWRGVYFSDVSLTGAPVLVRNDTALDFNWGRNTPGTGLPADRFSVRWTRDLGFEGGQYRFHAVVDDGVRVWVDDQLIIDEWQKGAAREVTADHTLSAGKHNLRIEYFELTGEAFIRVWWERTAHYPDWKGEYWPNRTLSGEPTLVRNDVAINFDWSWGAPAKGRPADSFSARWTRTAHFDVATYRFHVVVDDGARFWVDDRLVIDSWHDGEVRELTADYALVRGVHQLRVEFYEHTRLARVHVWWERVFDPSYPDWKGEYWPNRSMSGNPSLVRNDEEISFDWDTGQVAAGLPVDDFSARWSRQMAFEAGVYRFYAQADDGIRLYVDGEGVLDQWHASSGDEVYIADVPLRGEHELVTEYNEHSGKALVKLWWKQVADWPTSTPTKTPTSTPTPTKEPPPPPPTPMPTPTQTPKPTATPPNTPEPTATSTPTSVPTVEPTAPVLETPMPVPISPHLNEVLPEPAAVDWDGNGVANERDEWIEIHSAAPASIDLGGWTLDGGPDSASYGFPQGTILEPDAFVVFYHHETGIVLNDARGEVRLLGPSRPVRDRVRSPGMPPVDDHYGPPVVDTVTYDDLPTDVSYSRDEAGVWHTDWPPSPGAPNLPPSPSESSRQLRLQLLKLIERPGGLLE
jgi:hypothetical protein